jgi:hypothetical protein
VRIACDYIHYALEHGSLFPKCDNQRLKGALSQIEFIQ